MTVNRTAEEIARGIFKTGCVCYVGPPYAYPVGTYCPYCKMVEALKSYAAAEVDAAVRAERERCAKVAEKWIYYDDPTSGTDPSRHEIAAAIRLSKLDDSAFGPNNMMRDEVR